MAVVITHQFESAKGDGPDPTLIQPSNWNEEHVVEGLDFGTTAGTFAEGNHTHSNAVAAGAAGFMTGADKTKLDGIETGAVKAYANLSGKPTLGTAAALDVGTGANNIPQLTAAGKYPAIDGSLITNLSGGVDYQEFTANGTWTKPAGTTAASRVLVQEWGAGGGGGTGTQGGGGGGGAYKEAWFFASDLGATESVGAPAGGATDTAGGNATFGSFLTAYGGGAGGSSAGTEPGGGGGGGGFNGAGGNGQDNTDGASGGSAGSGFGSAGGSGGNSSPGQGQGGSANSNSSHWAGAGGGGGARNGGVNKNGGDGGSATFGGAGGAGSKALSGSNGSAGTSMMGGSGGAVDVAGSIRGGGGGARAAGGRAEVRVTTFK